MNTQNISNTPTAVIVAPATNLTFVLPTVETKEGYKAFVKSYKENINRLSKSIRLLKQEHRALQPNSKKPLPDATELALAWSFYKQLGAAMKQSGVYASHPMTAYRWAGFPHQEAARLATYLIQLRRAFKVRAQAAYLQSKEAAR